MVSSMRARSAVPLGMTTAAATGAGAGAAVVASGGGAGVETGSVELPGTVVAACTVPGALDVGVFEQPAINRMGAIQNHLRIALLSSPRLKGKSIAKPKSG